MNDMIKTLLREIFFLVLIFFIDVNCALSDDILTLSLIDLFVSSEGSVKGFKVFQEPHEGHFPSHFGE